VIPKAIGRASLLAAATGAVWLLPPSPASTAGVYQSLPETSEPGALDLRLAAKSMQAGLPVMIRIFKAESQLEVWMRRSERFELLAVYAICKWSGSLGPKISEGDKQSPEGFYSIGEAQLHKKGRWPRSLDIGFPNTFDKVHERTGSYILVHGGCTTTGCYAMTNQIMEEIYAVSEAAIRAGQEHIPVHVFPFRMTPANVARHAESEWSTFWASLRPGYDYFERTHMPPQVSICEKRYVITEPGAVLPEGCMENESRVSPPVAAAKTVAQKSRAVRKAATRNRSRRVAKRNVRKAYAAARTGRSAPRPRHASAKQARYD
jgi:murein L,D-transpeptidase YafK